jgi:hypothetical protein
MNHHATTIPATLTAKPVSNAKRATVEPRDDGHVWLFFLAPISFVLTLALVVSLAP